MEGVRDEGKVEEEGYALGCRELFGGGQPCSAIKSNREDRGGEDPQTQTGITDASRDRVACSVLSCRTEGTMGETQLISTQCRSRPRKQLPAGDSYALPTGHCPLTVRTLGIYTKPCSTRRGQCSGRKVSSDAPSDSRRTGEIMRTPCA